MKATSPTDVEFSTQGDDGDHGVPGSAHIAYYWRPLQLSFVWDGRSEAIDVSFGGYAEPIAFRIPAMVGAGSAARLLTEFREHCTAWIKDRSNWTVLVEADVVDDEDELPGLVPQ